MNKHKERFGSSNKLQEHSAFLSKYIVIKLCIH